MLASDTITPVATDRPDLYAFRIDGKVSSRDMEGMAAFMNEAFDTHDKVDMLLIFDAYDGSEFGAGMNWENMKANLRALTKVNRYAVAKAPEAAAGMVEKFGALLPVEAEAFSTEEAAWAALRARAI